MRSERIRPSSVSSPDRFFTHLCCKDTEGVSDLGRASSVAAELPPALISPAASACARQRAAGLQSAFCQHKESYLVSTLLSKLVDDKHRLDSEDDPGQKTDALLGGTRRETHIGTESQ
jgi:hypothetical protein